MAIAEYFFGNPRPLNPCREIVYGFTEANSQSFYAGQLVLFSSGVAAAASDATTTLLGIAMKDATNVSSANIEIPIYPIYPDDTWLIHCVATGTAKLASAYTQGTRYGLYVASNVAHLDYDETSSDSCIVIEPVDTTNKPYWMQVRFILANCYFSVGTGA